MAFPRRKKIQLENPRYKIIPVGIPVIISASLVVVRSHHKRVFPLFPTGKWSKLVPGEKFEVHRVTWSDQPDYRRLFENMFFYPTHRNALEAI